MHTIGRVKRVEESKWDIQPKGFNNNIRWHVGHIFVTIEIFVQQSVKSYEPVYSDWIPLFVDGTSPDEWEGHVPTSDELLTALREQLDWIIPILEKSSGEKMVEPLVIGDEILTIDTIEGISQFLSWHEGTHAGVIDAMNRFE